MPQGIVTRVVSGVCFLVALHLLKLPPGYAFKTTDKDYIGVQALTNMISFQGYRKDIVAGGLTDFIVQRAFHSLPPHSTIVR